MKVVSKYMYALLNYIHLSIVPRYWVNYVINVCVDVYTIHIGTIITLNDILNTLISYVLISKKVLLSY